MKKYTGKTLLMLGTSIGSVDIVNYVKQNGGKTIVIDYMEPSKSMAKTISDENYKISTLEIDKIVNLAQIKNVNAVFAGISEQNLEIARRVSENLNLVTLYTAKQWNDFTSKICFRDLCMKYNIPTPKTFFKGNVQSVKDEEFKSYSYPIIVKPDDCWANVGITICYFPFEVMEACHTAAEHSKNGRIIIEKLIEGREISATYVVHNNKSKLVCYGDKYASVTGKGLCTLPDAYIYPGQSLDSYIEQVDSNVKKMIENENINNCTLFIQGIFDGEGFAIFESGLRMEGTKSYMIVEKITGENFMEFLIDNLMNSGTKYNISKNNPYFNGEKCIKYSMISTGGILSKIIGFEELDDYHIFSKEKRYSVGDYISNDGTLKQLLFRFNIVAKNIDEAIETIKYIQRTVHAYDEKGNEMVRRGFDPYVLKF